MELTIQVNPVERTVRLREVHALAAGDSCSVVLEGVRGADVASLRLALYRDAASDSPVASCPSFAPVRGHPNLATGDLRLDTAEMAAWFEAVRPDPAQGGTPEGRPEDAAERAVRTDGWLVVSEPTRTWAACRVPVVLRPGAGVSGVVDPTSIQSLVEGLVSAAMSEALASKADKATTLAGYGITDAATKTELDAVDRGAANAIFGVQSELSTKADLVDGKVPANQLPSYVDDVLEYDSVSAFPSTGENGKIYVAKDTNKTYRWGGTQYVEISQSLALGETSETAYPGDKGKAAAEKADAAYSAAESLADGVNSLADTIGTHIRDTTNPHKVTAAQVGALPLSGGTVTGNLTLEVGSGSSPTLEVSGVSSSGIKLNAEYGGKITVGNGSNGGGQILLKDSSIPNDVEAEVTIGTIKVRATLAAKADKATTLAGYGITDAATMASLAPEYSPSSAYAVGSFVYHDGNIYQCKTAIADGGEAWNAAHWELMKLDDFFTNSNSLLTATIDARLPYPINAVPSTGLLKDRTINTTSLASVTVPDNFTDLLIRASVASSLSVTMPEAIATKYGDTFPGEAGEYLITITKTGASEAYVRTIKLEVANA